MTGRVILNVILTGRRHNNTKITQLNNNKDYPVNTMDELPGASTIMEAQ